MSGKKTAGGPPRVHLAEDGTLWSAFCPPSEQDSAKSDGSHPAGRVMSGDKCGREVLGAGGGEAAGHPRACRIHTWDPKPGLNL